MPDYTLGPTEHEIREAHLYLQIPSMLTIAEPLGATLRNDGPTPLSVIDGTDPTPHLLPPGATTPLGGPHYTLTPVGTPSPGMAPWQALGRFTVTRTTPSTY